MFLTDDPETVVPSGDNSPPLASAAPSSATPEPSSPGPATPTPEKNIQPAVPPEINPEERLPAQKSQTAADVTPDRPTETAQASQDTISVLLGLFEQLAPRDQLDSVMTEAGMPVAHRPSKNLTLAARQNEIAEWAVDAGPVTLVKLRTVLQRRVLQNTENFEKPTAHSMAPKASIQDVTSELRKEQETTPSYLDHLAPVSAGLLPLEEQQTNSWATRLHSERLLLLSCVDPSTLNAIARTLPSHPLFGSMEKLQVARREMPSVWQVLEARKSTPGLVAAYALGEFGEQWLRKFPILDYDLAELRTLLERTETWLLLVTTPETAKRAGFHLQGGWIEDRIDFIGPKIRAALGPDQRELEAEFRSQRAKGYWGETDDQTLQLLNDAIAGGMLEDQITMQAKSGPGAMPAQQPPDWNELLQTSDPQDRTLCELILFGGIFFSSKDDLGEGGLAVPRFDALIRNLIPIAAPDSGVILNGENGPSATEQLNRAWLSRGVKLMTSCGLRTVKSESGSISIRFSANAWREQFLAVLSSTGGYWLLNRLSLYVRRREFVLGPEDWAQGTMRVAAAQASLSSVNDFTELLNWVGACITSQKADIPAGGLVTDRLKLCPAEDRIALGAWLGNVLRQWQSRSAPGALLEYLMNNGAHDFAAAVLRRLWGKTGLQDVCLASARRLLNEAPAETKAQVSVQIRNAMRSGDLPLLELWRRNWLPADQTTPGISGRAVARLLVEVLEGLLGGPGTNQLFRKIFDEQDPAAMHMLAEWLCHPAVESVIRERQTAVAALPGLWILPEHYRRLVVDGTWEVADGLLTVWWFGFLVGLREESAMTDPLPLLFRAMTVVEWAMACGDTPLRANLLSAVNSILQPAALQTFRSYLSAFDSALGNVLHWMLRGSMVRVADRRAIEARIRPLRACIRDIRRLRTPAAAGI